MENKMQKTNNSMETMESAPAVSPYMDIYESADEIIMIADMPGVTQQNLELKFENNEISIKGNQSPLEETWKPRFCEYKPLRFERGFKLPSGIDVSKIRADFTGGVLTVTLPKSEHEKPHTIKINSK